MSEKILVEADLGIKAVERCDIVAYFLGGKLIGSYPGKGYDDLPDITNELRTKYPDSEIEVWCLGDDCTGRTHRWRLDI